MMYKEPRKLIIQVEDSLIGQVLYYWIYYQKPCQLLLRGAKTEGITGLTVNMNNPDAGSFVFILIERLNVRLYDAETKQPVTGNDLFYRL